MTATDGLFDGFVLTAAVAKATDPNGYEVDAAELSWDTAATRDAVCVWVQVSRGDEGYGGLHAEYILRPSEPRFITNAGGLPGRFCFRAMLISEAGRSPFSEACVFLENPAGPVNPSDAGDVIPPDTGSGMVASNSGRSTWIPVGLITVLAILAVAARGFVRRLQRTGHDR